MQLKSGILLSMGEHQEVVIYKVNMTRSGGPVQQWLRGKPDIE